ncbi:MAG: YARHG domain-containing protein [Ruminococcaceae bacterium]|nr:YARHG domain-containing protein [Oscillospiraceae bacterium]
MKRIFAIGLVLAIVMMSLCACSMFTPSVNSLELSETDMTLTVGDSKVINVTPKPDNAKMGPLTWSSTDSNIAKVDDGTVIAMGAGSTVVSVKTEDGVSASCNITINEKEITKITLNKTSTSVKEGKKIQLEADITPADAPTGNLKWSSSNDDIATVNSEGYVTGIKAGTVNITCRSSNDIEASCTVTVEATKSSSKSNNDDAKTVVNNFYGYGHYHPDYEYSASDFVFPESSSRQLTRSEISNTLSYMTGYSPANNYAQDAINEIYARNGYIFSTDHIRAYYESKPWYYPDSTFTTGDFSSVEKYNIALLEEFD